MRKVVVCVFAHPDDEAFGPGGTLAVLSKTHDVIIISVTDGEAGQASLDDININLSQVRKNELLKSAKILGVKKVYFLGYKDGCLSNSIYHAVASEIEEKLRILKPEIVITFEPKGVSGHIDHIAVSFITTYVVKKLPFISSLHYFCITPEQSKPSEDDYFIYFPKGYSPESIDLKVDIAKVWNTKIQAMNAHVSQSHDAKKLISILEKLPKEEHFLIFKNN